MWANRYGEAEFGSADQDAVDQAASPIRGARQSLRTSPSRPSPVNRKLCRFLQGRRIWWPSCMGKQKCVLLCAPNHEGAFLLRLSCLRRNRRVPTQWRGLENHRTTASPADTLISLPEACRRLRNQVRESSDEMHPWGPKGGPSCWIRSN